MTAERPVSLAERLPYLDINQVATRLVGEFRDTFLAQPTFVESAARIWLEHRSQVVTQLGDFIYSIYSHAVEQIASDTFPRTASDLGDEFEFSRERGEYRECYALQTDGAPPADGNYGPDIFYSPVQDKPILPHYAPNVIYENSDGVYEVNTQQAISAHENLLKELQAFSTQK